MTNPPTPPYTEATGPKTEASKSDLLFELATPLLNEALGSHMPPGQAAVTALGRRIRAEVRRVFEAGEAAGRAQAAEDIRALIPRESTEIVDWLQSHKLGLGAGPGAVLSWLRYDMDALVASWAAAEGGGVADQSKDHR